MHITRYKIRPLIPPKGDLYKAIQYSRMKLREGDIVAISSKVVSIGEGRSVRTDRVEKRALIRQEAERYYIPPKSAYRRIFTIARGMLVGSAGIDESNGADHFILYPEDPDRSAKRLRTWLMKTYGVRKLGVILTDSTSIPLRRGAIGFALAWSGFDPLRDYRGTKDLFGRAFEIEVANLADALASAAVFEMGEGSEQTPIAVIRGANVLFKERSRDKDQLRIPPEDDLFAPLLFARRWKRDGAHARSKSTHR